MSEVTLGYVQDQISMGAKRLAIEVHLKNLPDLVVRDYQDLAAALLDSSVDMVLLQSSLEGELFEKYLLGLIQKMQCGDNIWKPAIIFNPASFGELVVFMEALGKTNWFFDIVHPDHLSSLPMRVFNLYKIKEQLAEMIRYQEQLDLLTMRLADLEQKSVKKEK